MFGYHYLDHYWTEPGRYAFFIRVKGKLTGFVLVRILDGLGCTKNITIAEFFVLGKYRRLGVGKTTAMQIFDRFPGQWSIDQEPGNLPAQRFWRRVIGEYTHGRFEESITEIEREVRPNQRFVSRQAG